eukprot:COSAG02_NODE_718_length_18064_cov_5.507932_9_plen_85_part_00
MDVGALQFHAWLSFLPIDPSQVHTHRLAQLIPPLETSSIAVMILEHSRHVSDIISPGTISVRLTCYRLPMPHVGLSEVSCLAAV